jgi:type I restriction enzyme, S subunit
MTPDLRWDAEYYRPEYLRQDKAIGKFKTLRLGDAAEIRDGNHLSIAEEFVSDGVRYLRGQDLGDFFVSDSDPIYIPRNYYAALTRSHMYPGDVLISIVGTIGRVGLVTDRHSLLTGSCKLAIARTKGLPPEYIATYLASRIGQNEIARRIRGAIQMGLILPDLKELPIVDPKPEMAQTIVSLVRGAQKERKRATETFESAEERLTEVLGLADLELKTAKSQITGFDGLSVANRCDAEYFCMPGLRKWKSPLPIRKLGDPDIAALVSNGVTPAAVDYGEPGLPIIKVGDVDSDGLAAWGLERVRRDAISARGDRGDLKKDDVVVLCAAHHIRYIGKAGLFVGIEGYDGPVRSVGELITVRAGAKINPQSLCLYLNLPAVRNESQRYVRGLSAHLYPDDFRKIPVPVLPVAIQDKLADLFEKSLCARKESARLLDEAKEIVENMVTEETGGRMK